MIGQQRIYQIAAVLITLAGLAVLVAVSLGRTGGMLVYTIDDPYIHLAVAENILRGGYGVNAGAFSAPSSSILYPFVLAGLLALGAGDWAPLIAAGAGSLLTAWLLAGIVWRMAVAPHSRRSVAFAAVVLVPLLLAVNILALPLTGMEHTLHMAASIAVVIGLYETRRDAPVHPGFLIAVILVPLLRYEGLALAIPAILALLWHRKFAAAAIVVGVLGAALGAFSYMLILNGQPFLPSSVMVKSPALSSVVGAQVNASPLLDILSRFGDNLNRSFDSRYGTIFGVGIALMALALSVRGPNTAGRVFVGFSVSLALMAHNLIGHFDWFDRYEIYAMAMMFTALVILWSEFWRDTRHRFFFKTLGAVIFLTLLAVDYSISVFKSPEASRNVYQQQYQMHRFATEYFPQTVAVNDLGYVAYRNEGFVLDLWGLGSEEARMASTARGGRSPDFMRAMTTAKDAKYAMIYERWYKGGVPPEWCRVATLNTIKISVAYGDVQLFLIDRAQEAQMQAALDAFAPTLPEGAFLDRFTCQPP